MATIPKIRIRNNPSVMSNKKMKGLKVKIPTRTAPPLIKFKHLYIQNKFPIMFLSLSNMRVVNSQNSISNKNYYKKCQEKDIVHYNVVFNSFGKFNGHCIHCIVPVV